MAQHDYNIANQTGADFRADLNNALLAISSNNSGSSEPSTMYAYEWWIDTSANVLKLRNSSNNAWITMPFSITADNTVDINAGTVNGITSLSFSSGATVTSILDEDDFSSDSSTALATQQSIKAYIASQITLEDLDISDGSSTISIDLDSETLSLLGGTGVTSTASGNGVTFAIGQSVGTSDNVVFNQVTGALVGNASTATALATARTISGVSFDGTANITLDTDDIGEGSSNLYFTDTRANSAIDARVTNTFINNLSGVVADTATALATGRTIGLSGDVTATGVSFDGTGNITLSTTIAPNSIALGTDTVGNYVATIAGSTNEIEVSGSGSETATVTIGLPDNVTISGNLTVNGTTTTVNSDTLAVTDPLIKLAKANSGADSLDIGFYGLYDTSGSQDLYAGLFRDANDSGKFKLFKDLQVEPTTTVNTSGTGYAVGTLVSNLEGNVTGNVTGNVSGSSSSTTGNAATATALETARTIGGVSFDGTGNIDLAGVNTTGNQDTSGNAATATALATGRTIGMTGDVVWTSASFDGSGNVTGTATIQANSVALGTDTTGDYVSTITGGTGITSTGATSGEGIAHSLSVDAAQTQITSVGALDGGSITSGFGSIDVGSSAITTTGTVTGGTLAGTLSTAAQTNITSLGTLTTLTVDDITINGSTISDAGDLTIDTEADLTLTALSNIIHQTTSTNPSAGHHIFKSFNTEIMRIDGNNNRAGIANTAPNANLHVGSTGDTGDTTNPAIQIGGATTYRMGMYTSTEGAVIENKNGDDGIQFRVKTAGEAMRIDGGTGNCGIGNTSPSEKLSVTGNVTISGSLSKGSGSFKINHPLESKQDTHFLVHSFVEAPQADNIYRGKVDLVDGFATVNIDTEAGMTEGTFEALNTDIQCFTTNESDFDAVKGNVTKNILTINCQNTSSTATISWLVIGERKDQHIQNADWTDKNGKVIVEVEK